MAIHSPHPLIPDQLLNALATLGAPVLVDPQLRPGGLTEADVPELLGHLLAVVELETAAQVRPYADPPRDLALLVRSWREGIDDEPLAASVLAHRAQRTLFDWILAADTGTGAEADPVARATGRTLSAVQALIGAHLHRNDAPSRYRILLDQAEHELSQALAGLRRGRAQQG